MLAEESVRASLSLHERRIILRRQTGDMAEWTNALVLKTRGGKTPVGSNPTVPALKNHRVQSQESSILPFAPLLDSKSRCR